mgnify:CR=1 FL=1
MRALGLFNYWVVIFLMMVGFYTLIARGNLIKKLIGLNIFQTSVFILYITMGKITGGTAPNCGALCRPSWVTPSSAPRTGRWERLGFLGRPRSAGWRN